MIAETLALLPLDDRPPTWWFPQQIARIAGLTLILPPRALLGNFLQPGNPESLAEWLEQIAPLVNGFIVAADMLAYGGLVASRSPSTSLIQAKNHLRVLETIHARFPQKPILVASVIMRISITASDANLETAYQQIIRYSELFDLVRRQGRSDLTESLQTVAAQIPPSLLNTYWGARKRNHAINCQCLEYLAEGVISDLLLLQEDASTSGPHFQEQEKIRLLAQQLGVSNRLYLYPGADEGTQTLLARWINQYDPPGFQVRYTSPQGAGQTAPFEDRPLQETVHCHLLAAGAQQQDNPGDSLLWVHTPCSREQMMAAVSEIKSICDQGVAVALADVRYPNGSDPELMALLNDAGILNKLAAYAGWNTAGNTMGTTLAMASAWRAASLQPRPAPHLKAHRAFLWERVADDWGYQSVIRQEIETIISRQGSDCLNLGKNHSNAEKIVHSYMQDWAAATWQRGSWPGHMPKMHIRLPWPRTFEVDIRAI